MTTPRSILVLAALAVSSLTSCTLWDPEYEPDPNDQLHDLLAPLENDESAVNAVDRERIRVAVEQLAIRHAGHVPSQVSAAALAFAAGDRERSQGFVDRALALAPDDVVARTLRVRIAVADGSMDLARKLVDDGIRLRPDAAALYESSAWLHQLEGRSDDALRALDAAQSLDAPIWRVAYHRGLIEEQRGNLDAAKAHYRAALDADESCEDAQRRLTGLDARARLGR